jgi:phosphate transport system substrate-binding protein
MRTGQLTQCLASAFWAAWLFFAALPAQAQDQPAFTVRIATSIEVRDLAVPLHRFFRTQGAHGDIVRGRSGNDRDIFITNAPKGIPGLVSMRAVSYAEAQSNSGGAPVTIFWTDRPTSDESATSPPSPGMNQPLAMQALAVAVHPDNPIMRLSSSDLRKLVAGGIRSWDGVPGGNNDKVRLILPAWGDDALAVLRSFDLGVAAIRNDVTFRDSIDDIETILKQDRGAITLIAGNAAGRGLRRIAIAAECGQPYLPTAVALKTGSYPLRRQILIRLPIAHLNSVGQKMVSWIQEELSTGRLEPQGFYGLDHHIGQPKDDNVRDQRVAQGSEELGRLLQDVATHARPSSYVFRFARNSSVVEGDAKLLLDELRNAVRSGRIDQRQIILLGFSDNTGTEERNAELSQQRANAIADELASRGVSIDDASITGLSNLSVIGCPATENGRQSNRRVEVWVRM